MMTRVSIVDTGTGYQLTLTGLQRQLIAGVLIFMVDRPGGDVGAIVRTGSDRAKVASLCKKVSVREAQFSLEELHVIFSSLAGASCLITSEEEFHTRIGFFKDHALSLASGLVLAISSTTVPSADS